MIYGMVCQKIEIDRSIYKRTGRVSGLVIV